MIPLALRLERSLSLDEPERATSIAARAAAWSAAGILVGAALAWTGLGADHPEAVLAAALGLAPAAATPRQGLWAPAILAATLAAAAALAAASISPLLGAGAVAGAAAGWLPRRTRGVVPLILGGALGAGAAGLGARAAVWLVGPRLDTPTELVVAAICVAVTTSLACVAASTGAAVTGPPSARQIRRALRAPYRVDALHALEIYRRGVARRLDRPTEDALAALVHGIVALQGELQRLDDAIDGVDAPAVRARIAAAEAEPDPSVRDATTAAAAHLARLLEHRDAWIGARTRLRAEATRALACLEEAAAAAALDGAREVPSEAILDAVTRVRAASDTARARRRAHAEVARVGVR